RGVPGHIRLQLVEPDALAVQVSGDVFRVAPRIEVDIVVVEQRDVEFLAVVEEAAVVEGNAGRSGIPPPAFRPFADLLALSVLLATRPASDGPDVAADAVARFEDGDVVAELDQLPGRRAAARNGAEYDHLGALTVAVHLW